MVKVKTCKDIFVIVVYTRLCHALIVSFLITSEFELPSPKKDVN